MLRTNRPAMDARSSAPKLSERAAENDDIRTGELQPNELSATGDSDIKNDRGSFYDSLVGQLNQARAQYRTDSRRIRHSSSLPVSSKRAHRRKGRWQC